MELTRSGEGFRISSFECQLALYIKAICPYPVSIFEILRADRQQLRKVGTSNKDRVGCGLWMDEFAFEKHPWSLDDQ